MDCQICDKDIGDIIVLLPISRPGGYLDTMACLKCAEESDAYCRVHNRPHEGWGEGMHRCYWCAHEMTQKNRYRVKILVGLIEDAAKEDFDALREEKCMPFLTEEEKDWVILFFFSSMALAMKADLDELVRRVVSAQSLEITKN